MDMDDPKALRLRRLEHEIKAQDVAEAIGVTPGTLSKWERGRVEPTPEQVRAWGKALRKMERALR